MGFVNFEITRRELKDPILGRYITVLESVHGWNTPQEVIFENLMNAIYVTV